MSEWHDSQKKPSSNFLKLLKERIETTYPRRNLTAGMLKGSLAEGRKNS